MDTEQTFARTATFPSWFPNVLGQFLSVMAGNFLLKAKDNTHVHVPAGAGRAGVAIAVDGRWRFAEAEVSRAMPGGPAGTYDVFVTAQETNIVSSPAPYTDATFYGFDLAVVASGTTPSIVAGVVDVYQLVGHAAWDGAKITQVTQVFPPVGPHASQHAVGGIDPITPASIAAATVAALTAETTRASNEETTLQDSVTAETARAEAAEAALDFAGTFQEVGVLPGDVAGGVSQIMFPFVAPGAVGYYQAPSAGAYLFTISAAMQFNHGPGSTPGAQLLQTINTTDPSIADTSAPVFLNASTIPVNAWSGVDWSLMLHLNAGDRLRFFFRNGSPTVANDVAVSLQAAVGVCRLV